jgi:hypothetical protein
MTLEGSNKYDANFTAGGLLYRDFTAMSSILSDSDFLEKIQRERELNLLLGIPTKSARKRVISEIKRRYEIVTKRFWDWYLSIPENEKKLALFYICLKTYPLVLDLHLEVSLKKYRIGGDLNSYAVKMRMDELAASDEEVCNWSESTLGKINSQYRSSLKDCGLLNGETLTTPINISESFFEYFESIGEGWFKEMCFK